MVEHEKPKVILIASPNNPTGNGLTPEELDTLLADIPAYTTVVVDEAYASFVSADAPYIRKLINKYPNLIISRTFQILWIAGITYGLRLHQQRVGTIH